jgi:hypothetical protein
MYEFEQDPATGELRVVEATKVASVDALRSYVPKSRRPHADGGVALRARRVRRRSLRWRMRWLVGGAWGWLQVVLRVNQAPRRIVKQRLAICQACPKWNPRSKRCGICSCKTDWKVKLKSTTCPDEPKRW